ncbi:hypothetical protein GH714_013672 [Hevea brasiliensis]|uniref:Basic secretory protease n=1 Tax=Hevea brasiliensis TaxID=3981 RepID=A0A6A6KZV5_HEVBR|nr:hypothetical protein GH714_013672 [Hevea brasiliensis]
MFRQAVILSLLVILANIQGNQAVDYTVTNTAGSTAGGARFAAEIGEDYSKQMSSAATDFIWRVLQQPNAEDRKAVDKVSLFIDDIDGVAAYASNNEIHFSANYIGNYSGDLKREYTGVLYHEMTHIWQWYGNGQAQGGLTEGVADFVRLKANYAPSHWVQPGQGDRWDQGYDVTARFLDYCNDLRNGFVAELNKKMRDGYSDQYFVDLLGKTVDQLWSDYKANKSWSLWVEHALRQKLEKITASKRYLQLQISFGGFQQPNAEDRKAVDKVSLFIDDMGGVAYASNNEIHVSANYIGNYSGDLKREYTGVLYHEMTHIWQWNGNGQAPGGLIEGVADFVRLKANYAPSHWVQPGQGDRWDQGYDVTARFLDYCNDLRNGFVAELNKKMRDGYSDQYFVDLLGKTVDQLWSDYKAKYAQ